LAQRQRITHAARGPDLTTIEALMYTTLPARRLMPKSQPVGAAVVVITCAFGGTGSVFALSHPNEWGKMLDTRVPYFDVQAADSDLASPDIRSAAEHIAN